MLQQLIEVYQKHQCSVVAVEEVTPSEVSRYGIVSGDPISDHVLRVSSLVEKPAIGEASGNLAIIGRYILTSDVLEQLSKHLAGVQGEVQLTDALVEVLKTKDIFAYKFSGKRYDCGNKWGYMHANIEMGLRHSEIGSKLKEYLKTII